MVKELLYKIENLGENLQITKEKEKINDKVAVKKYSLGRNIIKKTSMSPIVRKNSPVIRKNSAEPSPDPTFFLPHLKEKKPSFDFFFFFIKEIFFIIFFKDNN